MAALLSREASQPHEASHPRAGGDPLLIQSVRDVLIGCNRFTKTTCRFFHFILNCINIPRDRIGLAIGRNF